MDIVGTVAAIGVALKVVKELKDIESQYDTATFKLKIAELASALADAKIGLVDVNDTLQEKQKEIVRLKEAFAFKATLAEERGYKYECFPDGTPKGEPFCPRCEQKDGLFFRLNSCRGTVEYRCPECKATYSHVTTYLWEKDS